MKSILVTGSDTGIGKTWVVGALAARFAAQGKAVQIVKPVESGVQSVETGDAETARTLAKSEKVSAFTLRRFSLPIAPAAAAKLEGKRIVLDELCAETKALPKADWRLIEGAGGLAVPLEERGADWVDFARKLMVEGIIIVVPDRLGAINQARLAISYALSGAIPVAVWLNGPEPEDPLVAESNRESLASCGIYVVGETVRDELNPVRFDSYWFASL